MPRAACAACGSTSAERDYLRAGTAWLCDRCVSHFAFVGSNLATVCRATSMTAGEIAEWAKAMVWST